MCDIGSQQLALSHHAPEPKQWDKKSKVFSNKRGQAPSYCDRILLRSFPGVASDIRQDNVLGCHDFLGSDHRPVRSSYTLHLRKLYTAQPEPSKYLATTPPTFFSAVLPSPLHHFPSLALRCASASPRCGLPPPAA